MPTGPNPKRKPKPKAKPGAQAADAAARAVLLRPPPDPVPGPVQAGPVIRQPPDLVRPEKFIDPEKNLQFLLFGANYNDPAAYNVPSYARMLGSALPGRGA
jgi:hypothetical protein